MELLFFDERERRHDRLIDLQTQSELKRQIISQGQALYGSRYPAGSTFDVVIEKEGIMAPFSRSPDDEMEYTAKLIVYTEPNSFCKKECAATNRRATDSVSNALASLLDNLSGNFGELEYQNNLRWRDEDMAKAERYRRDASSY